MFAVIETGGKQLKVSPGDRVRVEKLSAPVGENVIIKTILMVADDDRQVQVGSPYIEDAAVDGRVLRHAKSKKVTVMKYKPKKRYRIKTGHRQEYTLLEIDKIRIGERVFAMPEPAVKKAVRETGAEDAAVEKETHKLAGEGKKPGKKSGETGSAQGEEKETKKSTHKIDERNGTKKKEKKNNSEHKAEPHKEEE